MLPAAKPEMATAQRSFLQTRIAAGAEIVEEVRRIADAGQRLRQRWHLPLPPAHADPLGGEIDTGALDPVEALQRLLDGDHAGAAVDCRHGEFHLVHAAAKSAAAQPDLVRGGQAVCRLDAEFGAGSAAAHLNLPSEMVTRRMSR